MLDKEVGEGWGVKEGRRGDGRAEARNAETEGQMEGGHCHTESQV